LPLQSNSGHHPTPLFWYLGFHGNAILNFINTPKASTPYGDNKNNQQSISNLHTFSSVHCQKEKYSNETKLFSSIKFNVLGS
jgi:cellobiose-specific phosphotransferase system component IIC